MIRPSLLKSKRYLYYNDSKSKGASNMNILLLGATGRVGSCILNHALEAGHYVNALVRNTDKIERQDEKLGIISGSVLNAESIRESIEEADLVISALGTDGGTTLSESMPLIIKPCRRKEWGASLQSALPEYSKA